VTVSIRGEQSPLQQSEDPDFPAATVLEALTRIFASKAFRASARRKRLLSFLVEQAVAGRAGRLKPYTIAVDVLGHDETFDPQVDPIVRLEVGRLRRDLEHYYLTDGHDDPLRITIPKGGCVPAFDHWGLAPETAPQATTPPPTARRRWLTLGVVLLTLTLGVTTVLQFLPWSGGDDVRRSAREAEPAVLVIPLEAATGDEGSRLLASGLTDELIVALMRFDALRVFAGVLPSQGSAELPPAAAAAAVYIVTGRVERTPSRIRVTVRLTDHGSSQVLWSQSYDRALMTANIFDLEAELAAGIASRLAQPYGVINEAATRGLSQAHPESLTAYDCVQQALTYRRTFAKDLYPPVRSCLQDAVQHDPGYADAWAMLAFVHLDAARYELVDPAERSGEMAAGLEAALRAVTLAPDRVRPLQSLAALRFMSGDYDEAERAQRRAIALNPNDPESLAQLGWRLMARGRWNEGGRYLQDAIDRSIRVPGWYYGSLALALYLAGDFVRALDAAELNKGECCGLAYSTLAITAAAAGHPAKARVALDEALREAPILGHDPRAFWAKWHASDNVIDRLVAGLAHAGLKVVQPGARASTSP
jgi:TolB-like protein/Tfp pilus assembly protein PilF